MLLQSAQLLILTMMLGGWGSSQAPPPPRRCGAKRVFPLTGGYTHVHNSMQEFCRPSSSEPASAESGHHWEDLRNSFRVAQQNRQVLISWVKKNYSLQRKNERSVEFLSLPEGGDRKLEADVNDKL